MTPYKSLKQLNCKHLGENLFEKGNTQKVGFLKKLQLKYVYVGLTVISSAIFRWPSLSLFTLPVNYKNWSIHLKNGNYLTPICRLVQIQVSFSLVDVAYAFQMTKLFYLNSTDFHYQQLVALSKATS